MAKDEKPRKAKAEKQYTRVQAEKALSHGADPTIFIKHPNYHVRRKVWQLQGRPLPEDRKEQNEFLATLQGMKAPKDDAVLPGFYALLRQRILKEVPVASDTPTE